jgi:xylose isomerase
MCPFDAKIRRQSIGPDDPVCAHVGPVDACVAADMRDAEAVTVSPIVRSRRFDQPSRSRRQEYRG